MTNECEHCRDGLANHLYSRKIKPFLSIPCISNMIVTNPYSLLAPHKDKIRLTEYRKHDPVYTPDYIESLHDRPVFAMEQIHKNHTVIVDGTVQSGCEADACCINNTTNAISLRWADCQNITLYDPVKNVAACVHAGWQGLVQNVITNCTTTLVQSYDVEPNNLLAVSGASLCKNCAEFSDPNRELAGIDPKFFDGRNVDLVAIAHQQLLDAGLQESHIRLSNECPKCMSDVYWSYRGEQQVKDSRELRNFTVVELL